MGKSTQFRGSDIQMISASHRNRRCHQNKRIRHFWEDEMIFIGQSVATENQLQRRSETLHTRLSKHLQMRIPQPYSFSQFESESSLNFKRATNPSWLCYDILASVHTALQDEILLDSVSKSFGGSSLAVLSASRGKFLFAVSCFKVSFLQIFGFRCIQARM